MKLQPDHILLFNHIIKLKYFKIRYCGLTFKEMEFITLPPLLTSDPFWAYIITKLDIYSLVQLRSSHPYFLHNIKNPKDIVIERVIDRLKFFLGDNYDFLLECIDLEISGELLYECLIDQYNSQTIDFLNIVKISDETRIYIGHTPIEIDLSRKTKLTLSLQTNYLIQDKNIIIFRKYTFSNVEIKIIFCYLDPDNFSIAKGLELTKLVGVCRINKNNTNSLMVKNLKSIINNIQLDNIFSTNEFATTSWPYISITGKQGCIIS